MTENNTTASNVVENATPESATVLFTDLNLGAEVMRAVDDLGFTTPTEIQAKAIPFVLDGRDVIGRSSTGTGKTAAFGLPAIEHCDISATTPQTLILCPTRELAMQISEEMQRFAKYKRGVRIATIFGGQNFEIQFRALKIANIVIGTPGRIMDHMRRGTLKLQDLKMVVLDEADEMLNMGFYEDIDLILSSCPEERQTVLFSATMPPAILKLTKTFQLDPVMIAVDKGQSTATAIEQFFYMVPHTAKMEALNLLLQSQAPTRSIVFCNTKKMVDDLCEYLNTSGFKSIGLHGDMRQTVRTQVMKSFKDGRLQILVATDVAARGIDVSDVDAVFNFDIPQDNEYYVHRIGRTGRAGKTGISYTLVCNKTQLYRLNDIMRFLKIKITENVLPKADEILHKKQEKFAGKVERVLSEEPTHQWDEMAEQLLAQHDAKTLVSALMGLAVGKDKLAVPVIKAVPTAASMAQRPARLQDFPARSATTAAFSPRGGAKGALLSVDVGKNKGIAPNFIVGAIIDATGLPAKSIGKIEIFNTHTTIDLTEGDARLVLEKMAGAKIKNNRVTFTRVTGPQKTEKPGKRDFSKPAAKSFHKDGGFKDGGFKEGGFKEGGFKDKSRFQK